MAVSKLPQAPFRQDARVFPTPLIGDVLFSEIRDCTRITIPEYGTPHYNTEKWPNHKLVFVKQVEADQREGIFEFFYAADRENQDLYNRTEAIRKIEGRDFRTVTRTYVTPRADYDPSTPSFGSADPEDSGFVLYDREQGRIGQQELDSLYVLEARNYVDSSVLNAELEFTKIRAVLTPEKFQSSVPTEIEERIEQGAASMPSLSGDEFRKTETQMTDDLKKVETYTRGSVDAPVTLQSERAYVEGTKATIEETFSPDEIQTAETGLLISESQVENLGDGSSVRTTVKVSEWPVLQGSEWNDDFNGPVLSTQQFVAPTVGGANEINTIYRPINKDRSLKIVEQVPTAFLNSYMLSIPTRIDLDVPDVLESVSVIYSEVSSEADGESEGGASATGNNYKVEAQSRRIGSSSYEIRPQLLRQLKRTWGRDLPATAKFFFLPIQNGTVSESAIMQKAGATQTWPVFKPRSNTVVLQGFRISVDAVAGVFQSKASSGDNITDSTSNEIREDFSIALTVDTIDLPFTINQSLPISNSSASATVSARAKVKLTDKLTASASANKSATGRASVSPTSIPATSPPTLPTTGMYLIQSRIEPYRYGYAKCSAVVFNAANLT